MLISSSVSMRTGSQLSLDLRTPPARVEHGGDVDGNARKQPRPYSSRRPIHIVLRSSRAVGAWSLRCRHHQAAVTEIVHRTAERFGVTLYRMAIVGNHVHLVIRARRREELQSFLRVMAGQIAQRITGARRGTPAGKFWDRIAYSRLITWGREYAAVLRYVEQNRMETMGLGRFGGRSRRRRTSPPHGDRLGG